VKKKLTISLNKILLKIGFFIYLVFSLAYSNAMSYEETNYEVVNKTETYEIRKYSDRLAVQVMQNNQNNSFRKLFKYISGANLSSEKIDMTTPVTQTEKGDDLFMQFYLPSKFKKKTVPIPSSSEVEIVTVQGGYYAVIKYSGRSTDKNFYKHLKILKQNLSKDNISIKGTGIKATYNGPFTIPVLRRNEAMFNINWN
tara:strand:+ start:348 stop:941 length:594 start_codon:yes stop_codon:yes gene_type:complete